jgi:hypothetical protein
MSNRMTTLLQESSTLFIGAKPNALNTKLKHSFKQKLTVALIPIIRERMRIV